MRELRLVREGSTSTSLVLTDDQGEQFVVAVDDTLRFLVAPPKQAAHADHVDPEPAHGEATAVTIVHESAPARVDVDKPPAATPPPPARRLPEPDPLHANPLTMRPREIQTRIRAGATAAELAEEMGVALSRVEPYAHPVLLERAQIAQLARSSHPVRDDGPAKLTLAEVLAAAFGARGYSLAAATWDAFREPDGEWIIRVSWHAGLSENEAEWIYHRHSTTSATTEPRNAVAADLTDPNFVQPVRSLTSLSRGTRYEKPLPSHQRDHTAGDGTLSGDAAHHAADSHEDTLAGDDELLQHPDPEQHPKQRRRKAVTPHWEDVLLGVRTNTKRPNK